MIPRASSKRGSFTNFFPSNHPSTQNKQINLASQKSEEKKEKKFIVNLRVKKRNAEIDPLNKISGKNLRINLLFPWIFPHIIGQKARPAELIYT